MAPSRFLLIAAMVTMASGGACAQGDAGSIALSTDEALAFIKGQKLKAFRVAGGTPFLEFKEDGAMYGSASGSSDSGRWRIEDGKLCMTWRRWDYEGCGALVRVGNEVHHLYPGATTVHLIFK